MTILINTMNVLYCMPGPVGAQWGHDDVGCAATVQ